MYIGRRRSSSFSLLPSTMAYRIPIAVFVGMQMFTSLVAGAASTWVLTNSDPTITPSYHGSLWTTLQYIAFLSWSNLLLAPAQLVSSIRPTFMLLIYIVLWLGGCLAINVETPSDCFLVQHCTQIRATVAFAWWTFSAISINTILIFLNNGSIRVRLQAANVGTGANEAGRKTPVPLSPIQTPNAAVRSAPLSPIKAPVPLSPVKPPNAAIRPVPLSPTKPPNAAVRPMKPLPSECLQCSKPCVAGRNFCQYSCKTMAESGAPKLIAIHGGHHMYRDISNLFSSSWRGAGSAPSVRAIYAIVSTSYSQQVYVNYKRQIEEQRKCTAAGLSYGNEKRLWHGTSRSCRIGELGQTTACTADDCNVCRIIKGSFDIARANVGMFGTGIYTTAISSKADAFRRDNNPGIVWNALLLNRVVVGRSLDCSTATIHNSAPAGYDSIWRVPNQAPTNDETVVYSNDAIRPAYLVMFSSS